MTNVSTVETLDAAIAIIGIETLISIQMAGFDTAVPFLSIFLIDQLVENSYFGNKEL